MSGYIMDLREVVGLRPLIMAAAGVLLVDEDERVLLQHRADNGCWGIPGGAMELGESFEQTARREVFEETGLTAHALELLYLNAGEQTRYTYPNGDQIYLAGAIFVSRDYSGVVRIDGEESVDVKWFDIDDLPSELNPIDRPAIEFYVTRTKQRQGLSG